MSSHEAKKILDLKSTYMIPCLYHFYRNPPVLVRGEMQYLYDTEGKRYLDCYSGVTVMSCGHANPAIIEPAIEQMRALQHTTSIYLTRPMYELGRDLVEFLDCGLKRVFFVNSGTEANEGALLLAKLYTGRSGFVSLRGGLHGRTSLTMGLTGIPMWQTDPSPPPNLYPLPRPCCSACELGERYPSCRYACLDPLSSLLEGGDIAAVIAEPIQGNGGIVVPPDGYFEALHERVHRAGALLIMDEVQTGLCRTGKRFAFQHTSVEPDILTLAKALGNGFPIGAFCAREEVAACYTKPGASTTGGNALSAAAARAVLRYMVKHDLASRAAELGGQLADGLRSLRKACPLLSEVRGRGLMQAVEIRSGGDDAAITDEVLEAMKDRGFLIGKTGPDRNVLTFMPPLVVEACDIEALLDALGSVLAEQPAGAGT